MDVMTQTIDRNGRTQRPRRPDDRAGCARRTSTGLSGARLSAVVLGAVVLVTAIAPLATDMYVPAFPLVGRDLRRRPSQVQLTLTTFFVGMALGQLVGGPVSDRIGRRRPLLVSLAVLLARVRCRVRSARGSRRRWRPGSFRASPAAGRW